MTKIRIALDCRFGEAKQGVGTAVMALAKALSESDIDNQEYTFIVHEEMRSWLAPYVGGSCKLVGISQPAQPCLRTFVRKVPLFRKMYRSARKRISGTERFPVSDGFVEQNGFDLVHFPTQVAYLTKVRTIYQPWDLQHLHYPEFFAKEEVDRREKEYRAFCNQATFICVQAEWTKEDLHKQYGLPKEKICVIPWGSVLDAYKPINSEHLSKTRERYSLPGQFFFYPAVTWPHKNHIVIIRALSHLKECGIRPDLYFTGMATEHKAVLDRAASDLGVSSQLHYLGFLSPEELQAMYCMSTALVFPSKFEGFGLPILEAFHARTAVISSNATTLPEVGKDGALYFDPECPKELAQHMQGVWQNPALRQALIERGSSCLSSYSMKKTVKEFQRLYEKTAKQARAGNEEVVWSRR